MSKNLFKDKDSKRNEELRDELFKREMDAKAKDDLKEAKFLRHVRNCVERGIYMEHNPNGTMHICPYCQAPMEVEHDVYCQNCGQLVK